MAILTLPPRQDHWNHKLVEWAEAIRGRPYVWGQYDCVTLALVAVGIITGVAPAPLAAGLRPYRTEFGALRAMLLYGKDAAGFFADVGLQRVDGGIRFAQSGDLLIVHWPLQLPSVGVVVSRHVLESNEAAGVELLPLDDVYLTAAEDDGAVVMRVP